MVILLDIEGTVSPLAFVHDVMFPYARRHVGEFLLRQRSEPATAAALDQMARDAGQPDFVSWCPATQDAVAFALAEVHRLMDADAKATGLKQLQGLIWERGFHRGELRSTVFADLPPALRAWTSASHSVQIYSSGSVHAQKLFFAHTEQGDLTPFLSAYYDTTVGPKREAASYTTIAQAARVAPADILFVSDVVEELNAARAAGCGTVLADRPGNKPVAAHDHRVITTLEQLLPQ